MCCCHGHSLCQQSKDKVNCLPFVECYVWVCPSIKLPAFPPLSQHSPAGASSPQKDSSGPHKDCLDGTQTTQQRLRVFSQPPNSPDINGIPSDDGIHRKAARSTETPPDRSTANVLVPDSPVHHQMFSGTTNILAGGHDAVNVIIYLSIYLFPEIITVASKDTCSSHSFYMNLLHRKKKAVVTQCALQTATTALLDRYLLLLTGFIPHLV